MPGDREPRHRRLSTHPASVDLCRRFLLLASRLDCLDKAEREIEGMTDAEVIELTEPLVFPRLRITRLREQLRRAREAGDRSAMAAAAVEAKEERMPMLQIAQDLGYKTKAPVYTLIRRGR